MTVLALVRHAKSDWADAGLPDHDRPLNRRGRQDAPLMARRIAQAGVRPDVILSSTALRARTTAEAFGAQLGVPVDLDPDLYGAPARTLLTRAARTRSRSVMVVAHNPGISELARRLSGEEIGGMPPCAVAVFRWDENDWDIATAVEPASFTFDTP